jgi:hypothetical protein
MQVGMAAFVFVKRQLPSFITFSIKYVARLQSKFADSDHGVEFFLVLVGDYVVGLSSQIIRESVVQFSIPRVHGWLYMLCTFHSSGFIVHI